VVALNGLLLSFLRKQKNRLVKVIGSLLPVVILALLSSKEHLTFDGIDGNLIFVAQVGAIALGVTNLLWIISTLKVKPAAFGE